MLNKGIQLKNHNVVRETYIYFDTYPIQVGFLVWMVLLSAISSGAV